ncbi:MAG TPA: hypothetical protein VLZ10_20060 [Thermodesulfobacteriota bacterium]|nr:hypothetical protein [Thermodesulfobacteriota bacterium]
MKNEDKKRRSGATLSKAGPWFGRAFRQAQGPSVYRTVQGPESAEGLTVPIKVEGQARGVEGLTFPVRIIRILKKMEPHGQSPWHRCKIPACAHGR